MKSGGDGYVDDYIDRQHSGSPENVSTSGQQDSQEVGLPHKYTSILLQGSYIILLYACQLSWVSGFYKLWQTRCMIPHASRDIMLSKTAGIMENIAEVASNSTQKSFHRLAGALELKVVAWSTPLFTPVPVLGLLPRDVKKFS